LLGGFGKKFVEDGPFMILPFADGSAEWDVGEPRADILVLVVKSRGSEISGTLGPNVDGSC
jgi:hypothetical protein